METTLLQGPGHDWLVVGSNGAVGSELTRALLRSTYIDGSRPVDVRVHPRDSYAEARIDLLRSISRGIPAESDFNMSKLSLAEAGIMLRVVKYACSVA